MWERIFGQSAEPCPVPVKPGREFCFALLSAKIDAALSRAPGLETDDSIMSRTREATRQSLRRLLPWILPQSASPLIEAALYRFVLDHGDFGMHNMTVAMNEDNMPQVTSVYDWEGGRVVPTILSEPKMVVTVDLVVDESGLASIGRWGDGDSPDKMAAYQEWTCEYYKCLFAEVPEYLELILASLDARRIWFSLQKLESSNSISRISNLGVWAEKRLAQLDSGLSKHGWLDLDEVTNSMRV